MSQRLWSRTGWLIALWGITASTFLTAQSLPQYSSLQRSQQKALQKTIEQVQSANYTLAVAKARLLNRPIQQISPSGRVVQLREISPTGELIYDATYSTTKAGISTRTNSLYAGGSLG
ncbi:MAG: hypothetical protein EOO88_59145, partial [Pedobacter sp.]